jgi:thiamine-phosphate pyrophosphorylase
MARMLARLAATALGFVMDQRLVSWARAVKHRTRTKLPVLWLFTDSTRLPNPLPAIGHLPRGLCGVVFRHDETPGRTRLAAEVAKLCRRRRLALVIAGDANLARQLQAGLHLRGGRRPNFVRRPPGLITSSVHNPTEYFRARRAGVQICFVSAAFATVSHLGEKPLGPVRWAALARRIPYANAYALGGITGQKVISLARNCRGAGAIYALATPIS